MSNTQQTLAQMVRSKYPHAYDDMDDTTLEKTVLAKHPEYSDLPTTKPKTERAMQQTMGGPPMFVDVPQGEKESFEAAGKAGYAQGGKTGMEMVGGALGSEAAAGMRGVVGVLARMLGTGIGAAAGNVAGQAGGTGQVNPGEALQTGENFAVGQGVGEVFGAGLGALRSSLSRVMYSGAVAADGTPELSKVGRSILHPTELPENALRAAVPPPPEATAAAAKQAGEANATKLESQMKEVEAARQQGLTDKAKLEMQDATEQAAAVKREQAAARLATKNAPKPPEPSPFGPNATASNQAFKDLQVPTPPKMETDGLGIRWAVGDDGLRVSIPRSVSDADAAAYAMPKLQEQRQILGGIKSRTAPDWNVQAGSKTPFTSTGKIPPEMVPELTGQDLISRTKKIVQPGAQVTAEDLKRAGDLTQAPLAKLKQLAQWGDELAKNEIVRRLRQ